jgi:hypothetical protein
MKLAKGIAGSLLLITLGAVFAIVDQVKWEEEKLRQRSAAAAPTT